MDSSTGELSDRLRALEDEHAAKQGSFYDEIRDLKSKLTDVEKLLSEQSEEMNTRVLAFEHSSVEASDEIARLRAQRDDAIKLGEQAKAETSSFLEQSTRAIEKLNRKVISLKSDNDVLKKELIDSEQKITQLSEVSMLCNVKDAELTELKNVVAEMNTAYKMKEEEITRLSAQLKDSITLCSNKDEELNRISKDLHDAKVSIQNISRDFEEDAKAALSMQLKLRTINEQHAKDVEEYSIEIHRYSSDNERLQESVEALRMRLEDLSKQALEDRTMYLDSVCELEAQIGKCREYSSGQDEELSNLNDQLNDLRGKYEDACEKRDELLIKLGDAQLLHRDEAESMRGVIDELRNELKEVMEVNESLLQEKERVVSNLQIASSRLSDAENESDALSDQISQCQIQIEVVIIIFSVIEPSLIYYLNTRTYFSSEINTNN